jgi:hypothetical protein
LRPVWVRTRPVLQRRSRGSYVWACVENGIIDMDVRQAYYAFQTMRRWHERGHAARLSELSYSFVLSSRVGRFEGFTIHRSEAAPR